MLIVDYLRGKMLTTSDKVARAVHNLCETIKDQIQNTLAMDMQEKRLVLTLQESEKINMVVSTTADMIYHRGIDSVLAIIADDDRQRAKEKKSEEKPVKPVKPSRARGVAKKVGG
jgi:ATP adenylyltransferase/5',5'''-P-1,P-4-tetraphosphate phosphorylase II